MEVGFSSSFKIAFKKRIKPNRKLEAKFWKKLAKVIQNPYEPSLTVFSFIMGYSSNIWQTNLQKKKD